MNMMNTKYNTVDQETNLNDSMQSYCHNPSNENLEKLMEAGTGLIMHFVLLYNGGQANDDYIQAGFEGLLKSIKRFDLERKISFVTYAGHCIIGEIQHLRRKEASFYQPDCISKLQIKADHFIKDRLKRNDTVPSIQELAFHLNVKDDSIQEVMRSGLVPLHDLHIENISSQRHESFHLPIEDRILLTQAFHQLNEIQKKVISLLFFKEMTQQQIAEKLGTNQRKISRLLHAALKKLHEFMVR